MKIKIITDSTCDLTKEEIEKYDVEVIPITVNIDGEEFTEIDKEEYIISMRTAKNFSTSQPAVGLFLESYEKWTNAGYTVISLHVASALSGTYSNAASVAKEFNDVYVIDTCTGSRGIAFFIKDCYDYIQEGKEVKEIISLLEAKKDKVLTYVAIDKLDNLVRSGRLKKTAGLIGGLLNLKVLTKLFPEELAAIEKVRGKKKLVQAVIQNLKKDTEGKEIKSFNLANVLSPEYVELVSAEIKNTFNYEIKKEEVFITTPSISTHAGEGALGVFVELA